MADVVTRHHAGKAVLTLQETLMGEHVEVLANRDLRYAELCGEFRDGQASVLAEEVEEFHMTGVHQIRSFRQQHKAPPAAGKGSSFSQGNQAFSLRNFSMKSARATAPSYGIAL